MSANQANVTTALVLLVSDVKESRAASERSSEGIGRSLALISSAQSGFAARLDEHTKNDERQFDRLWLAIKWIGGIGTVGGLTVGGAKIASGMLLF